MLKMLKFKEHHSHEVELLLKRVIVMRMTGHIAYVSIVTTDKELL